MIYPRCRYAADLYIMIHHMSLENYAIIYAVVILASAVVMMNAYQNVTTYMKRRCVVDTAARRCCCCWLAPCSSHSPPTAVSPPAHSSPAPPFFPTPTPECLPSGNHSKAFVIDRSIDSKGNGNPPVTAVEMRALAYSLWYNNLFFFAIFLVCGFYAFRNLDSSINYILSVSTASAVVTLSSAFEFGWKSL